MILTTDKCVLYDDELWFVNIAGNMVCKTNVNSWNTEVIVKIPKKYLGYDNFTYDCAAVYKDRIILFPKFENWILDYNTKSKKFKASEIKCPELDDNTQNGNSVKFRNAYLRGSKLYLMPHSCHKIVEYDLEKMEYKEYTQWYDEHFARYGWRDINLFCNSLYSGNCLWFLCRETNAIMKFDLETKKTQLFFIGDDSCQFTAFCEHEDKELALWDFANKKIIIWDKVANQVVKEITLDSFNLKDGYLDYIKIFSNNGIILAPFLGSHFIVMDYDKNEEIITDSFEKGEYEAYISSVELSDNKVLFVTQRGIDNILYDVKNKVCEKRCFEVKDCDIPVDFSAEALVNEGENNRSLRKFIEYVEML